MRCSSCFQPIAPGSVFPGAEVPCPQCGALARVATSPETGSPYRDGAPPPQPVLPLRDVPASANLCPRCPGVPLAPHFDELCCPRCGGLFVPHRRLSELVHEHRASGERPVPPLSSNPEDGHVSYLRCPLCNSAMNRKNFGDRSGIVVDVCMMHGVWMDRGELDSVIAFAFDLPQDAAARAALLALVRRAVVPALTPVPPQYVPGLARDPDPPDLIRWLSRLFG